MKRHHFFTFLLASFFIFISLQGQEVFAQSSLSGDDVCGKWDQSLNGGKGAIVNPCGIDSVKTISQGVFRTIIALGLPLLVVFIVYRFVMAWYALQQGNANAYKEAGKKVTQAIIGFIIIVALSGGIFITLLSYLGVNESFLGLLKSISLLLIPHAYAVESATQLPNPLGFTSPYDFILGILNTAMKFFLYPAMIGAWVWSGFSYVAAQGAPEKLLKAHKLLLMAFISTLIAFTVQGFLTAVKGSVNKILPNTTTTTTTTTNTTTVSDTNGTLDGRTAPDAGENSAVCDLGGGVYGQIAGGVCVGGRGGTVMDVSCTVKNGGTCRKGGINGTCLDYICDTTSTAGAGRGSINLTVQLKDVGITCSSDSECVSGVCLAGRSGQKLCQ